MTSKKKLRKSMRWWLLPALAALTFFLTEVAARNPDWVEKYYSQSWYPVVATALSHFSNLFPFSLDDFFYGILILMPVLLLVLVIFKKTSLKTAGKIALNSLALVYTAFYVLWGFNYYRNDVNQRLDIAAQKPDTEHFTKVFQDVVEMANESRTDFEAISEARIDSLLESSFEKWAPLLKLQYPMGKRRAKRITLSRFFAGAGISGYFGPFFNEVHVSRHNLPAEFPFLLAHEKAHQFGITSEAEANFYAWVVCSRSESKHLRYSASLTIFRYFLHQGFRLEQTAEIAARLDEGVKSDLEKSRQHWQELRHERIDRVASKANDTYLKVNKIEDGIADYSGVVKHIMDFTADPRSHTAIQF